ncbi:unnamed protein product [Litomosoides sigmodontis]|uniref:Uncharacterized protein n=1 Tax=Litomosoides sigmodontis TaxID=42156 RepID=A0A3P6TV79_LITSI|nr:unnamed protein product [Litomosoides sigmodontis]
MCCYDKPANSLISSLHQAVIIFRATVAEDTGFNLKFRKTMKPAQTTPELLKTTTAAPRTTIAGENIWSEWGEWSQCSRPCGACGIQSRIRACKTAQCRCHSSPLAIIAMMCPISFVEKNLITAVKVKNSPRATCKHVQLMPDVIMLNSKIEYVLMVAHVASISFLLFIDK